MKLNTAPNNEAILGGVKETGEFRIRNSAKAFNILSSAIYSNKIRAIIRELSCNAYDSHVAAGNDAPFTVHLPTRFEPYFSVRDYGTGLSHEDITEIYTTYFESTKTDSNDFIGALGLGSKSPFSYTENFTVTAYLDGKSRIYTAFIGSQGVPSIALMSEADADEPNGIDVQFAVENPSDYSKFVQESQFVFKYFPVVPKFTGNTNVRIDSKNDEIELAADIKLENYDYDSYYGKAYAVMGNISYPLDNFPNKGENLGNLAYLLKTNSVLYFELGELDFQPSRESLSYDDRTILAIKTKLEKFHNILASHVEAKVSSETNKWLKALALYNLSNSSKIYRQIIASMISSPDCDIPLSSSNYSSVFYIDDLTYRAEVLEERYNIKLMSATVSSFNFRSKSSGSSSKTYTICPATAIFVDPGKEKYVYNRIWATKFDDRISSSYVFRPVDAKKDMDITGFLASIDDLPEDAFINGADLEKAEVDESKPTKNGVVGWFRRKSYTSNRYYGSDNDLVWASERIDDDYFERHEKVYYIPMSSSKLPLPDSKGHTIPIDIPYQISAFQWVKDITGNDEIFFISETNAKKKANDPNWIDFRETIYQALDLIPDSTFRTIGDSQIKDSTWDLSDDLIEDKTSFYLEMKKIISDRKKQDINTKKAELIVKLVNRLGYTRGIDLTSELGLKEQKFKEKYPLLSSVNFPWSYNSGTESYKEIHRSIAEYINLIDKKETT